MSHLDKALLELTVPFGLGRKLSLLEGTVNLRVQLVKT